MALLPARNILDGTALPVTSQMKTALGSLRDYLAALLGTDSADPAAARIALGAATRGANSDITSLTGLTTPLSMAQGGSGMVNGFVSSNASSGYQKLPSGLIIQWGHATYGSPIAGGATGAIAFSFPVSFPTACACVVAGLADAPYGFGGTTYARSRALSGADMYFWNATGNATWSNATADYFAIGY